MNELNEKRLAGCVVGIVGGLMVGFIIAAVIISNPPTHHPAPDFEGERMKHLLGTPDTLLDADERAAKDDLIRKVRDKANDDAWK